MHLLSLFSSFTPKSTVIVFFLYFFWLIWCQILHESLNQATISASLQHSCHCSCLQTFSAPGLAASNHAVVKWAGGHLVLVIVPRLFATERPKLTTKWFFPQTFPQRKRIVFMTTVYTCMCSWISFSCCSQHSPQSVSSFLPDKSNN